MKHPFERFQLQAFLIEALKEKNIEKPTEIQERLILAIKNGKDCIGQSQTGTGKTYAFLLPILDRIDINKQETQAVICAPTRELASQLYEEALSFINFSPQRISAMLVIGGTDRLRTMEKLKQNRPHIVVGTPGRIADMVENNALNPAYVEMFVVDEADQMLDMGFIEEVDKAAGRMGEDLQMMVFSATIPENLTPFLKKYLNNPRHVIVQPKTPSPKKISHWLIQDWDRDRMQLLVHICHSINPFLAIIFTNKKQTADEVFERLLDEGLNVDVIHGGISPRDRKKVMRKLQEAEIQYLVATDLVARGIDVEGISHIINFELPTELEYYIHRVGRTARAGWDGQAISIVGRTDENKIQKLEKKGIIFLYKDLKNGEWIDVEKRTRHRKNAHYENKNLIPKVKPKKIKPGYKKKARLKQQQLQKRLQRKKRR